MESPRSSESVSVGRLGGSTFSPRKEAHTAQRRRRAHRGSSVIEVLVAILILTVVAAGVVQGLAFTSAAIGSSRVQTVVTQLASTELEKAQATAYVDLGTVGGDPDGDIVPDRTETVDGVAYRIQTDVEVVDQPTPGQAATGANYKRITVRVTPQTAGGETFTESSILAPPVEGARAGQAYVAVRVLDAYSDGPVPGATVTMTLGGSTSTATTDANGQVVFPGLAPGAAALVVSKAGYSVADTDPAALQRTVRAGEPWQPTVTVFKPATVVANVVDDATGLAPTRPVTVTLTTPNGGTASQTGTASSYTYTQVSVGGASQPIWPSVAPVTLAAASDCYDSAQVSGPLPAAGYPAVTSQSYELRLTSPPHGVLAVSLRRGDGTGIPGATIQVAGGDAALSRSLTTDANGAATTCVPPSGASAYTLSANLAGYLASATAAVTVGSNVSVALVQPGSLRLLYGILPGTQIRIRQGATVVRQGTTIGLLLGVGVDFHEVPPGTYTAERWNQPLIGPGSWTGAKTVTVTSGQFLSYTL